VKARQTWIAREPVAGWWQSCNRDPHGRLGEGRPVPQD